MRDAERDATRTSGHRLRPRLVWPLGRRSQRRTATALPDGATTTVEARRDGVPPLIRTTAFDARERRAYEDQLLAARRAADQERDRLRLLVAGLQRSLLPASLVVPPGMTTAAHYHM